MFFYCIMDDEFAYRSRVFDDAAVCLKNARKYCDKYGLPRYCIMFFELFSDNSQYDCFEYKQFLELNALS